MTARCVRGFNFAPALAMTMTYLQRADQYLRMAPEYKKTVPSTLFYSMYELRNYKTVQGI